MRHAICGTLDHASGTLPNIGTCLSLLHAPQISLVSRWYVLGCNTLLCCETVPALSYISPLLCLHALPPSATLASCSTCVPFPLCALGPASCLLLRALGSPFRCVGSVLVLIARFASPDGHWPLLGGTPRWNAAGAASSISCSAARPPRLVARVLLMCGLIAWINCLVTVSLPRGCARRCMLTPLTLRLSAAFGCHMAPGSCLLPVCMSALCCAAMCSVLANYVLLVGASVADATVPAGEGVFTAVLVRSCLRPLSLLPSSRVAQRCPPSFRASGGADAEALLG
jgi:hypothetical protein